MKILLDDISHPNSLFPLGAVRSVARARIGILSIFEKWDFYFPGQVSIASEKTIDDKEDNSLKFPVHIIPSHSFLQRLVIGDADISTDNSCRAIEYPWQFFEFNDWAIRQDFEMITTGRVSQKISDTNQVIGLENIFLESGAKVNFSILNAENGPIYIGKNAEIMEGSLIRGPFVLGEEAIVKMGSKIYGATTIGPHCIAGGEIKNSILMGFSNKAHDGYLGDSVIGEWCNLGAGTNNSNLKNNVSPVRIWNKQNNCFEYAGIKCGLLMGDYSRSAINTAFNTGTIAGVCCNIFGNAFPPKFIDNFSWGNEKYLLDRALEDISNWKKLKSRVLSEDEIQTLKKIY